MQRGRGGRDDFLGFGDHFAEFGGFGRSGSLISSFFGGRDPFDDPFFTQPFGNLMGRSIFGPSMFGPSMFSDRGSLFGETGNRVFLEQASQSNNSKGPVIEELSDDDDDDGREEKSDNEEKENQRKLQDPDEAVEGKKSRHMQYRNNFNHSNMAQSQNNTFTFQSSTVTYGGPNGAYYTSATTRRMGDDGVIMEESKEADTTSGRAMHRVSRGIKNKGHSVTRKLNSDGKVETMQTLHNLNQDELPVFEEAWKGNADRHLGGWNKGSGFLQNGNMSKMEWLIPTMFDIHIEGMAVPAVKKQEDGHFRQLREPITRGGCSQRQAWTLSEPDVP
ncbi:hypothetical protein ZIOFF_034614 [Zingiber officinale]|uniref:Glycine-rich protein n=1 Tax=Zingiber officinale TaxID=94328 RepID=A0A8J5GSC6_ZINOF|nr:hypothetical protein ZIOFF_034614 [Zingiber officinale]